MLPELGRDKRLIRTGRARLAATHHAHVDGTHDNVTADRQMQFVVLASGFTGSDDLVRELQEHTKQMTAPYKYPREIEFMAELPKTVSGKIRRVELRDRA